MAANRVQRRMAAILAADVVGYSRLMGKDEENTLATLKAYRGIVDGLIAHHGTRERFATKQPGRELARPCTTTGAEDAAVPVGRIGSAVPFITCLGLQHFQHLSPSHQVCNEASVPDRGFRGMACCCGHCCLKRGSTTISST